MERNLKRLIIMSGMTYANFAKLTGMTSANLDRISRGGATKLSTAQRIVKVLNEDCRTPCTLEDIDIKITSEEET